MNEINISDVLNRISYSNNPTMAIAMVLEELNKVIFELWRRVSHSNYADT